MLSILAFFFKSGLFQFLGISRMRPLHYRGLCWETGRGGKGVKGASREHDKGGTAHMRVRGGSLCLWLGLGGQLSLSLLRYS